MAGRNAFHVEFGFNETDLTKLLEQRKYPEAEQLIVENSFSTYLDEGCYQRTPLYIVLSGVDQENVNLLPRNLYTAQLLVQHGANLNYRIPTTYFGSEYLDPGRTPVQLLVELYNKVTQHESHIPTSQMDFPCDTGQMRYPVIGLDNTWILRTEILLKQILDLIFMMLSNGADVNVVDECRMTPLHKTAIYSKDVRLLHLLCDNGGNLNAKDIRGNTPLGALLDGFPLGLQEFLLERDLLDNPYTHCSHIRGKDDFLQCLLSFKHIQIDAANVHGRSPLFNAMVRGDLDSAWRLLVRGSDPTIKGQVRDGRHRKRQISPFFAALCSNRIHEHHVERFIANKPRSYQFLAHFVDAGFFTKTEIVNELQGYLETDFPEQIDLQRFEARLLGLMFGARTTTLRQLCVRQIFHDFFLDPDQPKILTLTADDVDTICGPSDYQHPEDFSIYLEEIIARELLDKLLEKTNLPKNFLVYFDIELLRQRLCKKFMTFRWFNYFDNEIDTILGKPRFSHYSNQESDSDDIPSDLGDSDLEYW